MTQLAEVTQRNKGRWQADAAAAMAQDTTGRLARFGRAMQACTMGSTVSAAKLLTYDDQGEVRCTRAAIAAELGVLAGHPDVEQTFRSRQIDSTGVDWYPLRSRFESHWQHGASFVYWALISSGPGLAGLPEPRYGDYCLVIADPNDPEPDALAVLPGNSAARYDRAGVFDAPTCEHEVASWSERAELLAVKHQAQVGNPASWGALICNDTEYSEVVRAGSLPISMIAEARLTPLRFQRIQDLRTRPQATLRQDDRVTIGAFNLLKRWQRRFGLRIVSA